MAVTGPFTDTLKAGGSAPGNFYRTKTGYRQSPPYVQPLAYDLTHKHCVSAKKWGVVTTDASGNVATWDVSGSSALHAPVPTWSGEYYPFTRCYEKLLDEVNSAAQLAVDAAERAKTYAMVFNRVNQIRQMARALRKLDFRTAADQLGLSAAQRHRYREMYPNAWDKSKAGSKSFADLFLEWHFGWSPLIGTFGDVQDILEKDFAPVTVRASAKTDYQWVFRTDSGGSWSWTQGASFSGTCRVAMGCTVKVSNPNLYLAARLGLTNPLAVAWELVPFSFVVDWFGTFGTYLSSMSDFHGLTVTNGWTSRKSEIGGRSYLWNKTSDPLYGGWEMVSTTRNFKRTVGLTGPAVQLKRAQRYVFSNRLDTAQTRAAVSVALLVQTLRNSR